VPPLPTRSELSTLRKRLPSQTGSNEMANTIAAKVQFTAICLLPLVLLAVGTAMGQEYWVSTTGSDADAGTKEKPVATPRRARDAVREARKSGLPRQEVTVWLRGGVYRMDKTLELDARDSGTAGAPVVYRSAPGEEVRLVGGKQVPSNAFKPVTDPDVLKRLHPSAHGKLLQVNLKAVGITDYGKLTRRGGIERNTLPAALELFFNDRPMPLTCWPNQGWTRIAAVPDGPKGERFSYQGDRPERWREAEHIWVHGYMNRNWCDTYEQVATIDTVKCEIITRKPHDYRGYKAGQRIRFLNLLEELDSPGEWYLDRNTGTLYFWPPQPISEGRVFVSLLETPLVELRGCEHVTLRGFVLECTRGSGVEIVGGHHNLVAGCTLRNIGTVAVAIGGVVPDLERRIYNDTVFAGNAGRQNGVVSCDIHNTGEYGIILGGGDRKTLETGRNVALNNDIHHFGRWVRTYRPAVFIYGVGNRVAHNRMHDAPHTAVLFWGNDHVLEFNEVYRVCTDTGDAGAFYIGRDWSQRGSVIRYNYFHDLTTTMQDVMAVYLDDMACGTTVFGNIMCRINHAILVGGGRDNIIENNIFVDCPLAISLDNRGFYGSADALFARLKAVNHDRPPYSTRYPALARILEGNPGLPVGNVIARNISVSSDFLSLSGGRMPEEMQRLVTVKDNFTEGDPGFVAPDKGDFRLTEDSPALELGFRPIPFDKIGPYRDDHH
jgi:hypothetical protein